MAIATIDPTTGITLKTFDAHTPEEVENRIARAEAAFRSLQNTSFEERARWMHKAADILESEADEVARLIATEMGKTLTTAKYEALKSATGMRHFADHAQRYLSPETPVPAKEVNASNLHVQFDPLGVVLAVMPWNYPLWQAVRFAAPALMAGNTGLLKHASNVPQCALYLGDLFARGGFPEGAFQTLLVEGKDVIPLVDDARIRAVTLTGSVAAGSAIAEAAGRNIKRSVLELGGMDVFIVMPSADIEKAAAQAVIARLQNSGQSCIAAKRFYVHEDVYDRFEHLFVTGMAEAVAGDPLDESTSFGPLATERGRQDVHELVRDAREKGAAVQCGGEIPEGEGWYYPATVLTGVTEDMRIYREECFGPVACLYKVSSLQEAIALSNDSDFGLSSSVWTNDETEATEAARSIEAGGVFINGLTASFPAVPFGGLKDSGYGRELSAYGIREFVNIKTVWTS
ncbi:MULTISPECIES: aldehyde dehydrogenase AldH [Pseudarthrobacter]|uniref:NAD-dependent aldehyde dehydrogenase n=1 Tax=Pseudarthrobacter phenanthrenivorans (strain DSM 18606 / JCM 16027 / LMG 23796 / Sphe3) TaxID=930171 RepID=F0M5J5_PSEPM|nr:MULTISPECIES: aldehyde dehydrogenase AldH [Pseudarthrobacter]ADX71327.1 NAD-dependent aldehyde dehydrogenase [Pseudarthrobacter phenanthrenivorans Sphe3]MDV2982419.1 aldehyde dehydrogenase family protein [Actinomycetes bacterium ARC8]GKV71911.1 NADP-dependent succinic semialdehyde dehydrogenase [Pseudarthrobacter sp. NCCP-2145]